jgi:hypothetical protein
MKVGQEVLPLPSQDVADRPLESRDSVRVGQLLEKPFGLVRLRERRGENAAQQDDQFHAFSSFPLSMGRLSSADHSDHEPG